MLFLFPANMFYYNAKILYKLGEKQLYLQYLYMYM